MSLSERLRERRPEIERAALARVQAVADPSEVADPEYVIGVHEAVHVGLEYGISMITRRPALQEAVPEQLLAQARAAARNGISLGTVLRRYLAGHTLLVGYVIEEATAGAAIPTAEMAAALRAEARIFDGLLAAVSAEHARAGDPSRLSAAGHQARTVRMLLAGEPVGSEELGYELDAWHLAVIAQGPDAPATLRGLATRLDRRLLSVWDGGGQLWAWLGGRDRLEAADILALAVPEWPRDSLLALGEPGEGFDGWCSSHRQAKAAMAVARRGVERQLCYGDVALLSAALQDDVLDRMLRDTYLAPLEAAREGGSHLIEVLRAYFASGRNASSAAASLGISRQTANTRLRCAEERLGRPLDTCAAEMETALRLRALTATPAPR